MRVVFDTNVLIDGFNDDYSAAARLIEAARQKQITAVLTPAIRGEYRTIMRQLITNPQYQQYIAEFLTTARLVQPQPVTVTIDDPEDYKFLEAAVGGQADYIVTSDQHLLTLGEYQNILIRQPVNAWPAVQEAISATTKSGNSDWQDFMQGLLGG